MEGSMNIGVINESNKIENRAGLSPSGISFLVEKGHTVFVQAGTGLKSGYTNEPIRIPPFGCFPQEYFRRAPEKECHHGGL
jgi:hypothetical protein